MGLTSMMTPLVDECPAKLWPPLRIATCRPCRPANAIASEASWGGALTTNASGATSWNRLLNGRPDASYLGEPGRATSPAITRWSDPQSSMDASHHAAGSSFVANPREVQQSVGPPPSLGR